MILLNKKLAAIGLLAAGLSGSAIAAPTEQTQGDVTYIMGGIGKDESNQIKQMEQNYSVAIQLSSHDIKNEDASRTDYIADIPVTINDATGKTVLSVKTDGPYLLAKLPPGHYDVSASYDGKLKTDHISVGPNTHAEKVSFNWR